jgi:hypothetical protein
LDIIKFWEHKCKNKCMIVIMINYGQVVEFNNYNIKGSFVNTSFSLRATIWLNIKYVIPFKYFLSKLDYNVEFFCKNFLPSSFLKKRMGCIKCDCASKFCWMVYTICVFHSKSFLFKMLSLQLLHTYFGFDS